MDAQQEHDYKMSKRKLKLSKGSKQRLQDLLAKKNDASSAHEPYSGVDPIAQAMRNHPGLTQEDAEKMAEFFGF